MSQLIYRGWSHLEKVWVHGSYLTFQDGSTQRHQIITNEGRAYDIGKNSLGIHWGRCDDYKKQIFTWDIVEVVIHNYATGHEIVRATEVVEFRNGQFGIEWGNHREFTPFTGFSNTVFKVVGNLWEPPRNNGVKT